MTVTLSEVFSQSNTAIDSTKSLAQSWASAFTMDSTREEVMRVHQYCKPLVTNFNSAQQVSGIDAYAAEQWGPGMPNFTNKTNEIEVAADAVLSWIQANFPTVRSTLNASMAALAIPGGQQDALRTQMGDNLNYVLTHQIQNGVIVSPTLPAAALAPLVTLLNQLETAATMP